MNHGRRDGVEEESERMGPDKGLSLANFKRLNGGQPLANFNQLSPPAAPDRGVIPLGGLAAVQPFGLSLLCLLS
ncbi:unnamed protein product [Arctogadus glacialis]